MFSRIESAYPGIREKGEWGHVLMAWALWFIVAFGLVCVAVGLLGLGIEWVKGEQRFKTNLKKEGKTAR